MDARDFIKIGMSAERTLVVPAERTVGHFVPGMPMVYATPMMILEMEMASGDAIRGHLQPGWVTVGTEVDIRHLGASLVGATVRTTAKVVAVERRVIRFEVEAFEGERKIGDGRHARGLVNVESSTSGLGEVAAAHRQAGQGAQRVSTICAARIAAMVEARFALPTLRGWNYFARSFERCVAAATARIISGCMPSVAHQHFERRRRGAAGRGDVLAQRRG